MGRGSFLLLRKRLCRDIISLPFLNTGVEYPSPRLPIQTRWVSETGQATSACRSSKGLGAALAAFILLFALMPLYTRATTAQQAQTISVTVDPGTNIDETLSSCNPSTNSTEWGGLSVGGSGAGWASTGGFGWGPLQPGGCFSFNYFIGVPLDTAAGNYLVVWTLSCQFMNIYTGVTGGCGPPTETFQVVNVAVNPSSTTSQGTPYPSTGVDKNGQPVTPGTELFAPNTLTLSDGSVILLNYGSLLWEGPGSFLMRCGTGARCGANQIELSSASYGTSIDYDICHLLQGQSCVEYFDGGAVNAVRGLNFSISATSKGVLVDVLDGVASVRAPGYNSTTYVTGSFGVYSQGVTLAANQTVAQLQGNITTAFASMSSPCQTGNVRLNSGSPITGNLTGIGGAEFCVPPGGTTGLSLYIPQPLQNLMTYYSLVSNSSYILAAAHGETSTGGRAVGYLSTLGLQTRMPIALVSPSGDDPVNIGVNNTGSTTALVLFQLGFAPPAAPTTTSTTSSSVSTTRLTTTTPSTSSTTETTTTSTPPSITHVQTTTATNGIPEFSYDYVGLVASIATMVVAYVLVKEKLLRVESRDRE